MRYYEKNNSFDKNDCNSHNSCFQEQEILNIKNIVISIEKDLKKITEETNQEYFNIINSNIKDEYVNSIIEYLFERNEKTLEKRLIHQCDMRDKCKEFFRKYLNNNGNFLKYNKISKKDIQNIRIELNQLKKGTKYEKCDVCFDEVSDILENQFSLINSLNVYEYDRSEKKEISNINEEEIVEDFLDPVSNKQRMQILKSIALEPKTFSDLSRLTNLRGGNLLFHIQKLQKSDLIMQKHDRGEYILTKKGLKLISLISNLS